MRLAPWVLVVAVTMACVAVGQGKTVVVAPGPLAASRTLFLSSLGSDAGASLIREKLRASLIQGQRWRITEDSARAEVILAGSASNVDGQTKGTTDYAGTAVIRLVSSLSKETLWLFEYKRGTCVGCSVSTRVSSQILQTLEAIPQAR